MRSSVFAVFFTVAGSLAIVHVFNESIVAPRIKLSSNLYAGYGSLCLIAFTFIVNCIFVYSRRGELFSLSDPKIKAKLTSCFLAIAFFLGTGVFTPIEFITSVSERKNKVNGELKFFETCFARRDFKCRGVFNETTVEKVLSRYNRDDFEWTDDFDKSMQYLFQMDSNYRTNTRVLSIVENGFINAVVKNDQEAIRRVLLTGFQSDQAFRNPVQYGFEGFVRKYRDAPSDNRSDGKVSLESLKTIVQYAPWIWFETAENDSTPLLFSLHHYNYSELKPIFLLIAERVGKEKAWNNMNLDLMTPLLSIAQCNNVSSEELWKIIIAAKPRLDAVDEGGQNVVLTVARNSGNEPAVRALSKRNKL